MSLFSSSVQPQTGFWIRIPFGFGSDRRSELCFILWGWMSEWEKFSLFWVSGQTSPWLCPGTKRRWCWGWVRDEPLFLSLTLILILSSFPFPLPSQRRGESFEFGEWEKGGLRWEWEKRKLEKIGVCFVNLLFVGWVGRGGGVSEECLGREAVAGVIIYGRRIGSQHERSEVSGGNDWWLGWWLISSWRWHGRTSAGMVLPNWKQTQG